VSRLYDRVMTKGCRPLTARVLAEHSASTFEEFRDAARREIETRLGRSLTDEEAAEVLLASLGRLESNQARDELAPSDLDGAVVIAGDEVGHYFASLPEGTNLGDVVSVVAPPFERFLVEFNGVPNALGLTSWGVLFIQEEPQHEEEGWLLRAVLVGEWRRSRPAGPIATWLLPLDRTGHLFEADEQGYGSIFASTPKIDDVPEEAAFEFANSLVGLIGPALLTVSFMHCKNVDVRSEDPPERLSRSHKRKTGRALTRYYVLDIEPMRRILDTEGEAQSKGLRHALHICRGHFKTYTEESPLFGRYTGTYWWESQVRGKAELGTVEKDYRVRLDEGLGREYVRADEHPEIRSDAEHTDLDPDLGGRGLRAHNVTQNLLAATVEQAGYSPRRPKPDEPQYDLAWEVGETVWVAEVKSITPLNEERQLRLAVGQVVRYRQLLAVDGRTVRAMIAAEREPGDPSWLGLCEGEGIALLWPGRMDVTSLLS
jgi:hypothetical protein